MSGDNGNAPDLDLLADFTAGVLDGTPEGVAVADRIAAEPAWAELHAALVRADEAVRADLDALPVEPMPTDVFARLDAAFAAERSETERSGAKTETADESSNVVPLRRRSGWRTAAGAVAAGIVVLTAGTVGAELFQDQSSQSDQEASSTAAAPDQTNGLRESDTAVPPKSAPGGTAPDVAAGSGLLASGTEYRKETLPAQVRVLLTRPSSFAGIDEDRAQAPAEVQKLAGPADLESCLAAIGANGRPLAMDFATYTGSPAVVIVLQGLQTGTVDVVIVGPACGQPGPDLKLRTVVKR